MSPMFCLCYDWRYVMNVMNLHECLTCSHKSLSIIKHKKKYTLAAVLKNLMWSYITSPEYHYMVRITLSENFIGDRMVFQENDPTTPKIMHIPYIGGIYSCSTFVLATRQGRIDKSRQEAVCALNFDSPVKASWLQSFICLATRNADYLL